MEQTIRRDPLLVSKRDAAAALSVSVRTIQNLIIAKKLPTRRIGRRTLIPYSALRVLASRDTYCVSVSVSESQSTEKIIDDDGE
jgi:excisionase family DNA binding protein